MPTVKPAKTFNDRTDWDGLTSISESVIERMAKEDEDNPATASDDEWAHAVVGLVPGKTSIHASFDRDVVEFFKRGGRGYQTRMNAVLRRHMEMEQGKKGDR